MAKLNVLPGMEAFAEVLDKPKVKHPVNGYAAPPGTGPAGEKCKTCKHLCYPPVASNKTFIKCDVIKFRWTHGAGTDIRANSAACRFWEAIELHSAP